MWRQYDIFNLVLIETVLVEPQIESGQWRHFAITSIVISLLKRKDGPPVEKNSRTVFPNKWRYGKGTVGFRSCSPWDTLLAVESEGPWMGWNGLWRSGGNLVANLSKFWQLLFIWQVFEALPNESSALWTREDVHFSSHLCSGQVWLGILWQDSPSTCTWWNGTAAEYSQQVQLKLIQSFPAAMVAIYNHQLKKNFWV